MNTPGLDRFRKVIVSKRPGTCHFCGAPTAADRDFAALDSKWLSVCATCASSTVEQAKAIVRSIGAAATEFSLTPEAMAQVNTFAPANTPAILAGEGTEAENIAAVIRLTDALAAVRAYKPEDPIVGKLRAVVTATTATAWERDFAQSLIRQVEDGRTLSEKQVAVANKVIGKQGAAPAAPAVEVEDGGIYVVGTDYFLVHLSRAGRFYAKRLASPPTPGCKLDWQYEAGAINRVTREGRAITAAEAAALGHVTSFCCFCSLELRDEGEGRSVEVGYGPVCARKRGLPWG